MPGEGAVLVEHTVGPPGDGAQRIEVFAQPLLGARGYGRWGDRRLLGAKVEQRLLHDALALVGVGAAPGCGQPAQLPGAHRRGGLAEVLDELRAVLPFGPGQRNQMPHHAVGTEPPTPHQLLGLLRELAHQSESPGHPADRVAHQHSQLCLAGTVSLDQLR